MERSIEIQTAIYERLSAELTYPVFDHVPQKTTYPYVNIGEDTVNQDDTQTYTGMSGTLNIHTWSQKRGRTEIKNMMKDIYVALHRWPVTLSDGNCWELIFDFADSIMDSDGETRHGIQRFKIMVAR